MALIWGSAVPSSLQKRFAEVITVIGPEKPGFRPVRRNSESLSPVRPAPGSSALELASNSAEWLADRHVGYVGGEYWNEFKYLRQREILQGVLDPLYWQALVNDQNTMIKDQPTCVLSTSTVAPPYYDPDRQQSFCKNYRVVDQYDKSLVVDGSARPGYGWAGSVNNKIWTDDYSVAEMFSFAVPVFLRGGPVTPMYFRITVDYDISATIRGNKMWPSIAVLGWRRFPSHISNQIGFQVQHYAKTRYRFKGKPPPDSLPYQWVLQREWIVPYAWTSKTDFSGSTRWYDLYVVPVVPFGRYFANNDNVTCKGDVSVEAFYAVGP